MHLIFIFILINNIFNINSIYETISDKNVLSKNIRSLINIRKNVTKISIGNIPLTRSEEGLYTLKLSIGNPSQEFSLLLDTGSPLLWVNSNNCIGCQSQNKFNPLQSITYKSTKEPLSINYLSGEISGIIAQDIIKFYLDSFVIPYFYIFVVNQTNINFKYDGIFGLSKGVRNIYNLKYSTSNQLLENEILDENTFLLDFPHKNFYMDEIPSYLNRYTNFTCKSINAYKINNYYWHCNYDMIESNNNQFISNDNKDENFILFNSGVNSLIFPQKHIASFNQIILNNKLLTDGKCSIKSQDNTNNLYVLICENFANLIEQNNKEYENIFNNEEFIVIYLFYERKVNFKIKDLYDKEKSSFKLYFTVTPSDAIILGVPFFEKYPILFDKDEGSVVIYDGINPRDKSSTSFKIFVVLFVILILLLVALLVYIILRNKRKVTSSQIEKQFSNYGLFSQEETK
mgnify:CR=1 FL=1